MSRYSHAYTRAQWHRRNARWRNFLSETGETLLVIFAIVGIGLAVFFLWPAKAHAGEPRTLKAGSAVCISESALDRLTSYAVDGDAEAVGALEESGLCGVSARSTRIYLVDSTWTGKVAVRPVGKTVTVWTYAENVN